MSYKFYRDWADKISHSIILLETQDGYVSYDESASVLFRITNQQMIRPGRKEKIKGYMINIPRNYYPILLDAMNRLQIGYVVARDDYQVYNCERDPRFFDAYANLIRGYDKPLEYRFDRGIGIDDFVIAKNLATKKMFVWKIMPADECEQLNREQCGNLSVHSILGNSLIGHHVTDEVLVTRSPLDKSTYRIVDVVSSDGQHLSKPQRKVSKAIQAAEAVDEQQASALLSSFKAGTLIDENATSENKEPEMAISADGKVDVATLMKNRSSSSYNTSGEHVDDESEETDNENVPTVVSLKTLSGKTAKMPKVKKEKKAKIPANVQVKTEGEKEAAAAAAAALLTGPVVWDKVKNPVKQKEKPVKPQKPGKAPKPPKPPKEKKVKEKKNKKKDAAWPVETPLVQPVEPIVTEETNPFDSNPAPITELDNVQEFSPLEETTFEPINENEFVPALDELENIVEFEEIDGDPFAPAVDEFGNPISFEPVEGDPFAPAVDEFGNPISFEPIEGDPFAPAVEEISDIAEFDATENNPFAPVPEVNENASENPFASAETFTPDNTPAFPAVDNGKKKGKKAKKVKEKKIKKDKKNKKTGNVQAPIPGMMPPRGPRPPFGMMPPRGPRPPFGMPMPVNPVQTPTFEVPEENIENIQPVIETETQFEPVTDMTQVEDIPVFESLDDFAAQTDFQEETGNPFDESVSFEPEDAFAPVESFAPIEETIEVQEPVFEPVPVQEETSRVIDIDSLLAEYGFIPNASATYHTGMYAPTNHAKSKQDKKGTQNHFR